MAQRATASDTVNRLRKSSAVCQPGLYSRLPGTPTFAAISLSSARCPSARCISSSRRTMPKVLHHVLQLVLNLIRRKAVGPVERFQGDLRDLIDLSLVDGSGPILPGEIRRMLAGQLAEDEQVGKGVSAEAIRAMESGSHFPGGEKPGDIRHL